MSMTTTKKTSAAPTNPVRDLVTPIITGAIWSLDENEILEQRNKIETYVETLKVVQRAFDKALTKQREADPEFCSTINHFRKPRTPKNPANKAVDLAGLDI